MSSALSRHRPSMESSQKAKEAGHSEASSSLYGADAWPV